MMNLKNWNLHKALAVGTALIYLLFIVTFLANKPTDTSAWSYAAQQLSGSEADAVNRYIWLHDDYLSRTGYPIIDNLDTALSWLILFGVFATALTAFRGEAMKKQEREKLKEEMKGEIKEEIKKELEMEKQKEKEGNA
jgi:hypothetical protein